MFLFKKHFLNKIILLIMLIKSLYFTPVKIKPGVPSSLFENLWWLLSPSIPPLPDWWMIPTSTEVRSGRAGLQTGYCACPHSPPDTSHVKLPGFPFSNNSHTHTPNSFFTTHWKGFFFLVCPPLAVIGGTLFCQFRNCQAMWKGKTFEGKMLIIFLSSQESNKD